MTNPADVLTDEFNGRVARSAVKEILGKIKTLYHLDEYEGAIYNAITRALREEREPVHTLTFEVRAPTREAAITKFSRFAEKGQLWTREDITLIDPTERTS